MGWLRRLFGWEGAAPREARATAHPRDPVLAEWFAGGNTIPGVSVTPANALRCPAVLAPIRLLSGTLSILPAEMFLRTAHGGRERADSSPLYDLIHARPNAWQTSAQFRRLMTERMLGWGNAYARIVNPGAASALIPLHPDRVCPYRAADGSVWYRHAPRNGPQETLAADEVLHLRYGPALDDEGLEAESPIRLNRETVALAMAATEYLARFFGNAATPRGVLEADALIDRPTADKMRAQWEERHGGLANAHRLAILDAGLKFKPVSMTNEQAQFLDLYRQIASEIASKIFGIPPHLVGDTEKQSSWGTGIEQMSIGYVVHTVQPLIEEWEQSLDAALLTSASRRRFFFELNVDGLLRGDFKSRMEGYALQIQWGLVTPNEIRRLMNLAPLPGGDQRLQPLNMAPADRVMDVLLKKQPEQAQRALRALLGGLEGGEDGETPEPIPFGRSPAGSRRAA